jgi:hypothetical protein
LDGVIPTVFVDFGLNTIIQRLSGAFAVIYLPRCRLYQPASVNLWVVIMLHIACPCLALFILS